MSNRTGSVKNVGLPGDVSKAKLKGCRKSFKFRIPTTPGAPVNLQGESDDSDSDISKSSVKLGAPRGSREPFNSKAPTTPEAPVKLQGESAALPPHTPSFKAERDVTNSSDMQMLPGEIRMLEHEKWHELGLDAVVIQPYQPSNQSGDRQWATIQVEMSNCDSAGTEYSGLRVGHVEMIPFPERYLSIVDFANFSIGLAISPKGDLVAVYQEPTIGQWSGGSELEECEFRFCLLENPLSKQRVTTRMASRPNFPRSTTNDMKGGVDDRATASMEESAESAEFDAAQLNRVAHFPHSMLSKFIGYGAFLTKTKDSSWELNKDDNIQPDGRSGTPVTSRALFVACNGIYVDIFEVTPGHNWKHTHSINLTQLTPTINRRITCKMMMETISSDRFIWLEDDGLCCTIWDLQKGSNVSYLFSSDNTRLGNPAFRGNNMMAISPDESVVALASADGALTTFYADTGIMISSRKFSDHQVENVAFSGRNNELFVVVRNSTTFKLSSWILDPIQLDSGMRANQVPVPIMDRTIHAFFRDKNLKTKGLVCEADGSNIRLYVSHEHVNNTALGDDAEPIIPTRRLYSPQQLHYGQRAESENEDKEGQRGEAKKGFKIDKLHEVMTVMDMSVSRDDDGSEYWILRVEVVEKDLDNSNDKVIFSFVPEPWMRVSVTDVPHPEDLQQVYFLPGQRRFVLAGMQTLQIWSLPTKENSDFSLEFIWSRPRVPTDPKWSEEEAFKTELVGEYYHGIRSLDLYHDSNTGDVEAHIKLKEISGTEVLRIPGEHDNPQSILCDCARSIHLLSAAYVYSVQESKKPLGKSRRLTTFSFEEHAGAIARFTHGHINRLFTEQDILPHQVHIEQGQEQCSEVPVITSTKGSAQPQASATPTDNNLSTDQNMVFATTSNKSSQKVHRLHRILTEYFGVSHSTRRSKVITLLTLLLDQLDLASANSVFVEYLIATADHEWTPHPSTTLNPIRRAIDTKNESLLKVLIEYCVKNAMKYHPGYLEPVMQYQDKLLKWYPDIQRDFLRRVSYIPVHNPEYIISKVNISGLQSLDSSDWPILLAPLRGLGFVKEKRIENAQYSQINNFKHAFSLRSQLPVNSHAGIGMVISIFRARRISRFPEQAVEQQPTTENGRPMIYVSPFQLEPIKPGRRESSLTHLKDSSNNPVMRAVLEYKWKSNPYFKVFECQSPYSRRNFRSTHSVPVVGCFLFLWFKPRLTQENTGINGDPIQTWIVSFMILSLCSNILSELRVIKQLGIAIHIVVSITKKTAWYILILFPFLVGFTNALLSIYDQANRSCEDGSCTDTDDPSEGSIKFSQEQASIIIFLTLAIMATLTNEALQWDKMRGEVAHWEHLSEVIARAELYTMTESDGSHPKYIYYSAGEGEIEEFWSKHSILRALGPSPGNNNLVVNTIYDTGHDKARVQEELSTLKEMLKEMTTVHDKARIKDELSALKKIVKEMTTYLEHHVEQTDQSYNQEETEQDIGSEGSEKNPLQKLYLHSSEDPLSSPESFAVPARWDAEAGYHVVLLHEIQLVFQHPIRFVENIQFIKDDESRELMPRRIRYRSGVSLRVIEADSGQDPGADSVQTISFVASDLALQGGLADDPEEVVASQLTAERTTITDSFAKSPLHAHTKHYGICFEDMMARQSSIVSEFQYIMNHLLESMRQDTSRDESHTLWMREFVHGSVLKEQEGGESQSNKQAEHDTVAKQEEFIHAQRKLIDRLTAMQERIQDASVLALEALKHPVPRLFIVLLYQPPNHLNPSLSSTSRQLRLFFLCDCGQQLTTDGKAASSNIHLARHEGYELQGTEDFIKIYGLYLRSMFHVLKNGTTTSGFTIPSLSHMGIAEGVSEVQDILNLATNTIQSLMNETMAFIYSGDHDITNGEMDDKVALDVLESTDLRPIVGHLKDYDSQLETVDTRGTDNEDSDDDNPPLNAQRSFKLTDTIMLGDLKSTNWTIREKTVSALRGRVWQEETVLQAVIEAVADRHGSVREAAVRVLRGPSKTSRSAIEAVINAVDDSQWSVQEAAIQALGDQLQVSEAVFNALFGVAGSENPNTAETAKSVLTKHINSESVLNGLVEKLRFGQSKEQSTVVWIFSTGVKLPEAGIEALISTLWNSRDRMLINSAISALKYQAQLPKSAVEELLEGLQNGNPDIRETAIRVLGNQIDVPESAIPALLACLHDESSNVQMAATEALGKSVLPQSATQHLVSHLSLERESVREAAAKILGRQSTLSTTAIQALIKTLDDRVPSVRESVVQALGNRNMHSELVVPALVRMLNDNHPGVRGAAIYSLGGNRKLSESGVQALIGALSDEDTSVQDMAIQILSCQVESSKAASEALLGCLKNEDQTLRNSAIHAFSNKIQLPDAILQELITSLLDERQYVREAAVKVLGDHLHQSEAVIEALTNSVLDKDRVVQTMAADALRKQDRIPEAAIQTLILGLNDDDWGIRLQVVRVLSGHANSSKAVVEALISSLHDTHRDVGNHAFNGLKKLTRISDFAVDAMAEILHYDDWEIRLWAVRILGKHVQSSRAAASSMLGALRDAKDVVREAAFQAIHKYGLPESIVLMLLEGPKDENSVDRSDAIRVLNDLPRMPRTLVQALIKKMESGDKEIREAVVYALGGQVQWSENAVQALTGALRDPSIDVRRVSALSLGASRGKVELPQSTVLELIRTLKDDDSEVRRAADDVLGGLSTRSEGTVLALIEGLKDDDRDIRIAMISLLGKRIKRSEMASRALVGALKDEDTAIQQNAATALLDLGEVTDALAQDLIDTLQDERPSVRETVIGLLKLQTRLPERAVMALVGTMKDQRPDVVTGASAILCNQTKLPQSAVEALNEYVTNDYWDVGKAAAHVLYAPRNPTVTTTSDLFPTVEEEETSLYPTHQGLEWEAREMVFGEYSGNQLEATLDDIIRFQEDRKHEGETARRDNTNETSAATYSFSTDPKNIPSDDGLYLLFPE
ncbi:MAG: armadillo-type protein [Benniella sp.]|nr:MAG: armadillo-type protein [Benniella sp.]